MSRQSRHRQKRKAAGQCAYEGCRDENGNPTVCSSYYCERHQEYRRNQAAAWRARRREQTKEAA